MSFFSTRKKDGKRDKQQSNDERKNKEFLDDLFGIVHFTEMLSAKIHGVLNEKDIYRIIAQEFARSQKYTATILLLIDDGSALKIAETSLEPSQIRKAEKLVHRKIGSFKIKLSQSPSCSHVVKQGESVEVNTAALIKEFLPRPLAYLVCRFFGYGKEFTILTAFRCFNKIIGILAMTSLGSAKYFIPSVQNFSQHISFALEVADEHTKHQAAEDALRQSELLYRTLFENTPVGIGLATFEGKIIACNNAMLRLCGYQSEEEMRKVRLPDTYYHLQDRQKLVKRLRKNGLVSNFETKLKRKDGTVYDAKLNVIALLLNGEKILLTACEDISEQKRIDRAKTEFVSLASHQLRTPLTTINWYTETMLSENSGQLSKEQREHLSRVYGSSRRLVKLVNALLNVSRIDLGMFEVAPRPSDLKQIILEVLKELAPQIKDKKLQIKKSFFRGFPLVKVDPNLFRIIIENLLSNAVKYTPQKGKITVAVKKQAEEMLIEVKDNGCGIPQGQHSQVFEKLFRADNIKEKEAEGTGLGLYIAKAIIKQSGGKIWFESAENKGAVFYVSFPLTGMRKVKGTRQLTL